MSENTVTKNLRYPVIFQRVGDTWGYCSPNFGGGGAADYPKAMSLAEDLLKVAISDIGKSGSRLPDPISVDKIDRDGGWVVWLSIAFPVKSGQSPQSI